MTDQKWKPGIQNTIYGASRKKYRQPAAKQPITPEAGVGKGRGFGVTHILGRGVPPKHSNPDRPALFHTRKSNFLYSISNQTAEIDTLFSFRPDEIQVHASFLFYKNKVYKNNQAEICPKIKNNLRTITRLKF